MAMQKKVSIALLAGGAGLTAALAFAGPAQAQDVHAPVPATVVTQGTSTHLHPNDTEVGDLVDADEALANAFEGASGF